MPLPWKIVLHRLTVRRRAVGTLVAAAVALMAAALGVSSPAAAQTQHFTDTSQDAYYSDAVDALASRGVFDGTECAEGMLCPGEPIDRKTMAVWTVRALDGEDPAQIPNSRFSDVTATSFHGPFIERMAELGVTDGCGDGTAFCPDETVTRDQMAVFLTRAFDLDPGPHPGFTDVAPDAWYYDQVAALAASAITTGCGDGTTFCPSQQTTRAQMATFLARALGLVETPEPASTSNSESVDASGPLPTVPSSDLLPGAGDDAAPPRIEGNWIVPVFVCGPEGKYTAIDVRDLTTLLNDKLNGFFGRASSQRMSLEFADGAVVSSDQGWDEEENIPKIQRECGASIRERSPTPQSLMLIDTEYFWCGLRQTLGCGSYGGMSVSLTSNRLSGVIISSEQALLLIVIHELTHSVLLLNHLKYEDEGYIFLNEGWSHDSFSSFLEEPVLACYQYEQLGWSVPEYARPCVRLTPTTPQSLSIVQTGDDGLTLIWEPPRFTDDAPVTGYTVGISAPEIDIYNEPYESYEVGSDARSHTFYGPIAASGEYNLSVRATTKYGASDIALAYVDLPPAPPPPESVTVERVDNTSILLSWAGIGERKYVNLGYEARFSSGSTASTRWNSHGDVLLDNLLPGTEYTIDVRSCSRDPQWDINVCGSWGEPLTVSTEANLPPPDPVTVTVGSDWYLLTWEPVPGAVAYEIELPDGYLTTTYTPDFEQGYYGVQPGTRYSLKIKSCTREAFCDWGEQTEVAFSTTTQPMIPPPYRVSLKEIGDSWVDVLWDSVIGGPLYRVEYEYTDGVTGSGLLEHLALRGEPLRLTSQSNKTYTLKIRNCTVPPSDAMCSTWTSFEFSTVSSSSPLVPPVVQMTDVGDIWFFLSWDPVPAAFTYDWRYRRAEEDEWWLWGNRTRPSLILQSWLEPSTTYVVEVRSCGEPTKPCSRWTRTTVATNRSFPTAPALYPVSVEDATDSQIRLKWDPPSPNSWYDLKWYPSADRGQTSVRERPVRREDMVLSRLEPDTSYTIQVRTCSFEARLPPSCTGWVTLEASTRPRS